MKLVLFFLLLISHIYSIETFFVLKTGESLKVELIDENEVNIVYKNLRNGNTNIISKDEIARIEYQENNSQIEKILIKKKSKKNRKKKKDSIPKEESIDESEMEIAFFKPNFL